MANREQLYRYKGNCCGYCGLTVQEMMQRYGTVKRLFELNHIDPKKKDKNYDNLIRRDLSTAQLDEVDKCVLLCNQCHAIIHAQNITAKVKVCMTVQNRTVEQTLEGQLILDRLKRSMTFFTDAKILVCPYWVYIGSKKPKMMFGTELEGDFVTQQLDQIKVTKKMAIRSWDKKFLMRATLEDDGAVKLEHTVHCPFITSELHTENNEYTIWVRNGKWLTSKGEMHDDGVFTYYSMIRE